MNAELDAPRLDLRQQAVQSYEDSLEQEDALQSSRVRVKRRGRLNLLKGQLAHQLKLHVDPTEETFVIDGLTFGLDGRYRLLLLYMPCRRCGVPNPYTQITEGLQQLGQAIARYDSNLPADEHLCHDCGGNPRAADLAALSAPPSTEQQVIAGLTALIRRELAAMLEARS